MAEESGSQLSGVFDVLIVGGGPAGTAAAAVRHRVNSSVKSPTRSPPATLVCASTTTNPAFTIQVCE